MGDDDREGKGKSAGYTQASTIHSSIESRKKTAKETQKKGLWGAIGSTLGTLFTTLLTGGLANPVLLGLVRGAGSVIGGAIGAGSTGRIGEDKWNADQIEDIRSEIGPWGTKNVFRGIQTGLISGITQSLKLEKAGKKAVKGLDFEGSWLGEKSDWLRDKILAITDPEGPLPGKEGFIGAIDANEPYDILDYPSPERPDVPLGYPAYQTTDGKWMPSSQLLEEHAERMEVAKDPPLMGKEEFDFKLSDEFGPWEPPRPYVPVEDSMLDDYIRNIEVGKDLPIEELNIPRIDSYHEYPYPSLKGAIAGKEKSLWDWIGEKPR